MNLALNGVGDDGARALAAAAGHGGLPRLETLNLLHNDVGTDGARAVGTAAGVCGFVVEVEEASRGSRALGVGLRGAPQPSVAGAGAAGRVNRPPQ